MVLSLLLITKYKKIANIIVIEGNHGYNIIPDYYYRMDSDNIFCILVCNKVL
jgi:hypothetical protein